MTKDDVLEFIYKRGTECTFAEFSKYMPGVKGPNDIMVPGMRNAYVWFGVSAGFVKALDQLRESGRIIYTRTDPEVYDIFNMRPKMPIVPKNGVCLQKSWLPVNIELHWKGE